MKILKKTAIIIGIVLILLIATLTIRTFTAGSKQIKVSQKVSYSIDAGKATERLSKALQIPTISNAIGEKVDWAQFIKYREFLEKSFPLIHSTLKRTIHNDYNLIYVWQGSDPKKKPILFMAHYDVFAITDPDWKHAPFSGTIADGYVWGRGALDNKASGMSIMEAMEYLIQSGFKPTRSIYFAIGFDEENGGRQGAKQEAEYFKSQGLQFECMMDEGLFIVKGLLPGLPKTQWINLIGTEEKGFLNLKLTAEALSGHSSMPPDQTSIGILAAAIDKLEKNPFPARWSDSTTKLLDYIGPETSFPYNVIFANRWLFSPILLQQFAANPKSASQIRTTTAPDVFNAGEQPANMPKNASAVINFRLLPGDTMKGATDRVKDVINDPRVKIEPVTTEEGVWDTPVSSSSDSWSFQVINKTSREVMPDVLVTPCMVTGATDGRHFANAGLSRNWYRTLPIKVPMDDIGGVHSANERILITSYIDSVNYFTRLMQNFSED